MAASKRGLWNKIGRYITIVTLACFFLPFFGVSCEGVDVITVSGADMVGGCKPGGLIADAEDQAKSRDSTMKGEVKIENVDREPLAIVALLLALIIAGLAWVKTRGALIATFALSIACVGALGGLYVKVRGDMTEQVDKELQKKQGAAGSRMMKEVDIDSGSRFGLWATVLTLIGVAALSGLALKDKEDVGRPTA